MNLVEMYQEAARIFENSEYAYVGIRFEDKDREIGDICDPSRHNPDREDEREFPVFGTPEYDEMEILDGTSAYDLNALHDSWFPGYGNPRNVDLGKECSRFFLAYHCYIVASWDRGYHDDPDDGEILIRNAEVIAKLF